MVRQFVDNDPGYEGWLESHPDGFVVNTYRTPHPSYLMLHRSTCRWISGVPPRGDRWTGDYAKVCAEDRADLERWARDEVGGTLRGCMKCQP